MSCWVVPSVAAEFWGVTLDVVWSRIYAGQVPHKRDGGFVFVDVAPWAADFRGTVRHNPPPTYVAAPLEADKDPHDAHVALAADELELLETPQPGEESRPQIEIEAETADGARTIDSDDELPSFMDEETPDFSRLSWESTRRRVGRTRIPPKAA